MRVFEVDLRGQTIQKDTEEEKVLILQPVKRKRGRPRRGNSQISMTKVRQVIKEANELTGKKSRKGRQPGTKDKKPRKRRTKREMQNVKKKEKTCGVKIVALIVRVNGTSRVKVKKYEPPKLAPCEELICRITFEKDKIPVHSIFSEVRSFAETLAHCADKDLLHE